jgi:hypothetical protein
MDYLIIKKIVDGRLWHQQRKKYRQKESGMPRRLKNIAKMGSNVGFLVGRRVIDLCQGNGFFQHYFLNRQCDRRYSERVMRVLKGQAIVLIVVRHVGSVMHGQKLQERHILYLLPVFEIVFQQYRKAEHFVKLRIRVNV